MTNTKNGYKKPYKTLSKKYIKELEKAGYKWPESDNKPILYIFNSGGENVQ